MHVEGDDVLAGRSRAALDELQPSLFWTYKDDPGERAAAASKSLLTRFCMLEGSGAGIDGPSVQHEDFNEANASHTHTHTHEFRPLSLKWNTHTHTHGGRQLLCR